VNDNLGDLPTHCFTYKTAKVIGFFLPDCSKKKCKPCRQKHNELELPTLPSTLEALSDSTVRKTSNVK
jgi:hypothetical protein